MTLLLTRLTYLTALPLSASEGTLFTPPVCAGAVVRGMSLEVVLTDQPIAQCPGFPLSGRCRWDCTER